MSPEERVHERVLGPAQGKPLEPGGARKALGYTAPAWGALKTKGAV
jgi:hypothetical protein